MKWERGGKRDERKGGIERTRKIKEKERRQRVKEKEKGDKKIVIVRNNLKRDTRQEIFANLLISISSFGHPRRTRHRGRVWQEAPPKFLSTGLKNQLIPFPTSLFAGWSDFWHDHSVDPHQLDLKIKS